MCNLNGWLTSSVVAEEWQGWKTICKLIVSFHVIKAPLLHLLPNVTFGPAGLNLIYII